MPQKDQGRGPEGQETEEHGSETERHIVWGRQLGKREKFRGRLRAPQRLSYRCPTGNPIGKGYQTSALLSQSEIPSYSLGEALLQWAIAFRQRLAKAL